MLRLFFFSIYIIFFFKVNVFAQKAIITGKLINKDTGHPIEAASIFVNKGDSTLFFVTSDSNGFFKIPQKYLLKEAYIKVHLINYDDYRTSKITTDSKIWDADNCIPIISLTPKKILLKEVVVNGHKRYRDTTLIDVDKKFTRSTFINDVFSSKLGFSRAANGQLYYKGKPIADVEVNGGTFFGKNNLDIYQLMPASSVKSIQIVETNIDSLTNTNLLQPHIKVNLQLKEQYKKGLLADVNAGYGSLKRYLLSGDLYQYNEDEQLSLHGSANNINALDNPILTPKINFSANGNNTVLKSTSFNYRNKLLNKKLELNISAKYIEENKDIQLQTMLDDKEVQRFAQTDMFSGLKAKGLSDGTVRINYKIDTLNEIEFTQVLNSKTINQTDSLRYYIKTGDTQNISLLRKKINNSFIDSHNWFTYQKRFQSKKGRLLNIKISSDIKHLKINETDSIKMISNAADKNNFVIGAKNNTTKEISFDSFYTEPLSESAYVSLNLLYKFQNVDPAWTVKSDTINNYFRVPSYLNNHFITGAIRLKNVSKKLSYDLGLDGLLNVRDTGKILKRNITTSFIPELNSDFYYKINDKKDLHFGYHTNTEYPTVDQLLGLSSTFDLLYISTGNINLKPEVKRSTFIEWDSKGKTNFFLSLRGSYDHYSSKIGQNTTTTNTSVQNTFNANIGSANSGELLLLMNFNLFKVLPVTWSTDLKYQELPAIFNKVRTSNNGIGITQSLAFSAPVRPWLFITPSISGSFNRYYYLNKPTDISGFTYTDKIELHAKSLDLILYPLVNYSQSITHTATWSMNGELKKTIFKNYGAIWMQAYDIFNSFHYISNYAGSTFTQTFNYKNLNRFIIIGLSFKINNIK